MKKQKKTVELKPISYRKYYYLLGLFTFFIFANSIGNDYNMDDGIVTRGHKLTSQGLSAIGEIFTSNYYSDAMGYAFGYRPMVHLSFALEHELFGEKPGAGHFINVILFALSVVLFFKLLIKWVGEKNILFAGITAILFAVHPIHTEVVDSLKNRDELLAFLFVIWAGLAVHKFLDKGKWISLVSIVLLFTMAMLSKKSVYPIAIVIPAAIILVKNTSIKNLIILSLALIIPAAVIGSELELNRMGLMIILPLILLALMYELKLVYVTTEVVSEEHSKKVKSAILPLIGIAVVILFAILFSSRLILFGLIPFLIWLLKINTEIGLITLILALITTDYVIITTKEVEFFLLVIGVGYTFFQFLRTKTVNYLWVGIAVVTAGYLLLNDPNLGKVAILINFLFFIFLLFKKPIWAILFSMLTCAVAYFWNGITIYAFLILLSSILWFIYTKTDNINWIKYAAVVGLIVTLGYVEYENFQVKNTKTTQIADVVEKKKFVKNDNILKEGRQLEYVENTLIVPHTKEEKIGTGFATLGEYFRLMAFPYELSFYYGFAKTDTANLKSIWVWFIILIHLVIIVLAFFHIKKNPLITIGVFWYLLSIVLFSNWVELVAGMVGERLAFTASAGFCIMLTGILFWIKPDLNFKQPGIVGSTLIVVLVFFTGRTIARNLDWKDTVTLMGNDIQHLRNSSQANNIYAMHLMAESTNNKSLTALEVKAMQEKAIEHFDQATTIWPDYYNVHIDKARATMVIGNYEEGIISLKKAIKIDPKNEYAYYILLDILERTEDGEAYLYYAEELYKLIQNEHAYGSLARGYVLTGDFVKCKEILLEAIGKFPNNAALKHNLTLVEQKL